MFRNKVIKFSFQILYQNHTIEPARIFSNTEPYILDVHTHFFSVLCRFKPFKIILDNIIVMVGHNRGGEGIENDILNCFRNLWIALSVHHSWPFHDHFWAFEDRFCLKTVFKKLWNDDGQMMNGQQRWTMGNVNAEHDQNHVHGMV